MTIDQIIKAFLDGGITLGMLVLFSYMIVKLPAMMREAIELSTAPTSEAMRALAQNIEKMGEELKRLSVLIYLAQDPTNNGAGDKKPDLQSVLRATGMSAPSLDDAAKYARDNRAEVK